MNFRLRSLVLPAVFAAVAPLAYVPSAEAACSSSDPQCSFGRAPGLSGESNSAPEQFVTGFDWEQDIGGIATVKLEFGIKLAALAEGPFYQANLGEAGPVVEASWGDDGLIQLNLLESTQTDAQFAARYGLEAKVRFIGTIPSVNVNVNKEWNVGNLLTGLSDTEFNFNAHNSVDFRPWASGEPIGVAVVGGSVDTTSLFQLPFNKLGFDENAQHPTVGDIGVYVSTENTVFNYRTAEVALNGQILQGDGSITLGQAAEYGDELQIRTKPKGAVTINGALLAKPYVQVYSLLGYGIRRNGDPSSRNETVGINWPLRYSAGTGSLRRQFTLPSEGRESLPLEFNETVTVIPIPNVKTSSDALSMSAKTGKITLTNTGKKRARISVSVDNGSFQVPTAEQEIEAEGGTLDIPIAFNGTEAAVGQLTVRTNDPDSPQILINVGANGASVSSPNQDDPTGREDGGELLGKEGSDDEGGCGCRTTESTGERAGGFALAVALSAVLLRRRRNG